MSGAGDNDWERKYREEATPWDHGEAAPPLIEALGLLPRSVWGGGQVLVPGCGYGHDVAALAAAGLSAVGLDISETAVRRARERQPAAGSRFIHGDLFATGWREGMRITAVWEHTCLCALEPAGWPDYAAAVAGLLGPGQCLVGVFYVDPLPRDDGLPGPPFGARPERIRELLGGEFELQEHWVPVHGFETRLGREWLAVFRRRG